MLFIILTHILFFFLFSCTELWIILINYRSLFSRLIQNKRIDYIISNIISKGHLVFTESFKIFLLKCSQNRKLTQNSNLRDFRRSLLLPFLRVLYFTENKGLKFPRIVGSNLGCHTLTWVYDWVLFRQ